SGRTQASLITDGASLLAGFARAVSGTKGRGLFHQRLSRLWRLDPIATDVLRRALVLVADHELNPSTFAARIAASTGAPLAACALAGCSTLVGPRHGEASTRALGYLRTAQALGPKQALIQLAETQTTIPATGHPLYPGGDPRATALLKWMSPPLDLRRAIRAAERESGQAANVDMALAALCLRYDLPDDAPFLIFASGRLVGWIAHAIEQAQSGQFIRPRARYMGD
ncbi:MAG: citrate synthase, partial [Pseudomonadota bacterium]